MITTERLILRKMTEEDIEGLFLVFTNPRVMNSFDGKLFDRHQMDGWIRRNLEHQDQYGYGLFSIIHRGDDVLIGDCGLEHMQVAGQPEVELGYDLRSDYWGQGFATEAALAVRDFAFGELAIPRLISLIRPTNLASRRVAEKVGMVREQSITQGDQPYLVYAISKQGAIRTASSSLEHL
jgi:RimJ/RimL family protein N-acetyltransferase